MQTTPIEWTDYSANPLKYRDQDGKIVWACVHDSPGCKNCYAEGLARRYGRGGPFNVQTTVNVTPYLDDKELRAMLSLEAAAGQRCFPFDMTDLFGDWVPTELIDQVFAVLALRPDVTWQILTKRAARMEAYIRSRCSGAGQHLLHDAIQQAMDRVKFNVYTRHPGIKPYVWPLPNVWLGVSAENQEWADKRIPALLQTPAAVRFVSAEPLLGPVNLQKSCSPHCPQCHGVGEILNSEEGGIWQGCPCERLAGLSWVIVGGENGPRPLDLAWGRAIVQQCKGASIPVFVKQLGSHPWQRINGTNFTVDLKARKGGNMDEWPEDLRVREFPVAP